jgi:hypothetical protein
MPRVRQPRARLGGETAHRRFERLGLQHEQLQASIEEFHDSR